MYLRNEIVEQWDVFLALESCALKLFADFILGRVLVKMNKSSLHQDKDLLVLLVVD